MSQKSILASTMDEILGLFDGYNESEIKNGISITLPDGKTTLDTDNFSEWYSESQLDKSIDFNTLLCEFIKQHVNLVEQSYKHFAALDACGYCQGYYFSQTANQAAKEHLTAIQNQWNFDHKDDQISLVLFGIDSCDLDDKNLKHKDETLHEEFNIYQYSYSDIEKLEDCTADSDLWFENGEDKLTCFAFHK